MTIKEIASLAGVSTMTVSRVINSPHKVRPATLERVRRIMEKNHYIYDAGAADLVKKKSSLIGLITPTIKLPFFAEVSYGIQKTAQEKGYTVIIANTDYDPKKELEFINIFQQRRVAGIIFTGILNKTEDLLKTLKRNATPFVVAWETVNNSSINYVGVDRFKAAYSMTKYLIKLKHKRIGLLAGPSQNIARVKAALDGYRTALKDHNIKYDSSLVITRSNHMAGGKEAANALLSLPEIPTAIFVASGILQAIGALTIAREKGLNVPRDLSIAASGDVDLAAMIDPPLTAIRIPTFDVGQLAVEVLTEAIEGNLKEVRQYCLDSDLIVRDSCGEAKI